jgi:hypothetical protein
MGFKEHKIQDAQIAVYVPNENNELKLELGKASLKGGQLVIKFNDRLPGQTIQRMIARGDLMAVTLVPAEYLIEDNTDADASENNKENN